MAPEDQKRATPPVIDVRPQHEIPLGKALALCLKGITHRLFRSLLTLAVIVLAIAFFMSLLTESAFTQSVARGVAAENRETRTFSRRLAVWFSEPDEAAMAERLLASRGAPEEAREIAAVTGTPVDVVHTLAVDAEREADVVRFFDGLDAGTRAVLVKKTRPEDVLSYLADPRHFDQLRAGLVAMHGVKPPYGTARLGAIVARHAGYVDELRALTAAWGRGVNAFKEELGRKTDVKNLAALRELLARGDAAELDALGKVLAERNFIDAGPELATIHAQVARRALRERIQDALLADDARTAWHEAYLEDPLIDAKMLRLDDDAVVKILHGKFARGELSAVSRDIARESRLLAVEKEVSERLPAGANGPLIGGRQAFLMAISFIVCMVGITNAMLMAITERFREIATMKCLGATDGFILQQSLMEAAIQGLAGGVAGMLIGAVLTTIKCAFVFGSYLTTYFPWLGVLVSGGLCVLTGIVLSTLASIYPSWSASRMAPMDAMRIE
jgi:hypothetical protein